jgi:hypothetical protein
MSGNYGWDNGADKNVRVSSGGGFTRAIGAYKDSGSTSYNNTRINKAASVSASGPSVVISPDDIYDMKAKALVDKVSTVPKTLKSTAKSVVTVVMDVTGSMSDWTVELFARLPLLYTEMQKYLGDDLEILFAAFSDLQHNGTIQVTQFGRGKELENCILSIENSGGGGGNGVESAEVVAHYLANYVDTSSAKNNYTYFVTDEGILSTINPHLLKEGIGMMPDFKPIPSGIDTKIVMQRLLVRGMVFAVMANTNTFCDSAKRTWQSALRSDERVLILDDARRLVDVLIGSVAKVTDQEEEFTKDLLARQGGTLYGSQNIANVHKTLAIIPGSKAIAPVINPSIGTKSLI